MRRLLALAIGLSLTLTLVSPVLANDDKVSISFKIGSASMTINDNSIKAERSYRDGNYTLVPLRSIMEAFGAEVNWKGDGKITLIYRETTIDLTIGMKSCTVNGVDKELPISPAISNGSTMVPTRFITENFGADVEYNSSSDTVSITLEDDGAIKDFSVITGGISKAKIGNSYFGWSVSVPKGSQLNNTSLTSNKVSLENQSRGITTDIIVSRNESKNLNDWFNEINKTPTDYDILKIDESNIYNNLNPAYAEFLFGSYYGGYSIHRIYIDKGYKYDIILSSDKDNSADTIKKNSYAISILNSFNLSYKGNSIDVQDTNKIKDGVTNYRIENLDFSLDILPDWDLVQTKAGLMDIFKTQNSNEVLLGSSNMEYIGISVDKFVSSDTLDNYVSKIKEAYDKNYNTKYYNLTDKKNTTIAGKDAYKLVYNTTVGNNIYRYDENYVKDGNLIYKLLIKCPDSSYNSRKDSYDKVLNSIKLTSTKKSEIEQNLNDSDNSYSSLLSRIGKDDSPTLYENKKYLWSVKVPGYWLGEKSDSNEQSPAFINPSALTIAAFTAEENSDTNKNQTDSERFNLPNSKDGTYKFISKDFVSINGKSARLYTYRMENAQSDLNMTVKFYIIDGGKYSYAIGIIIDDIYTSDKNMNEIQGILNSFNPQG